MPKLTKEQRQEIVELYRTGNFSQNEIALKFSISQVRVSYIVMEKISEKKRKKLETKVRTRVKQ